MSPDLVAQVEKNMSQEYVTELKSIRFFDTGTILFVNLFVELSTERLTVWRDWLEDKYPSKRIVFV